MAEPLLCGHRYSKWLEDVGRGAAKRRLLYSFL